MTRVWRLSSLWRRLSHTFGRPAGRPAAHGMARIGSSGPARPAWLKAAAARFRCKGRGHIVAAGYSKLNKMQYLCFCRHSHIWSLQICHIGSPSHNFCMDLSLPRHAWYVITIQCDTLFHLNKSWVNVTSWRRAWRGQCTAAAAAAGSEWYAEEEAERRHWQTATISWCN